LSGGFRASVAAADFLARKLLFWRRPSPRRRMTTLWSSVANISPAWAIAAPAISRGGGKFMAGGLGLQDVRPETIYSTNITPDAKTRDRRGYTLEQFDGALPAGASAADGHPSLSSHALSPLSPRHGRGRTCALCLCHEGRGACRTGRQARRARMRFPFNIPHGHGFVEPRLS